MDLPPDKAKLLKQYDNEKKWDIICDQVSIHVSARVRVRIYTANILLFFSALFATPLEIYIYTCIYTRAFLLSIGRAE